MDAYTTMLIKVWNNVNKSLKQDNNQSIEHPEMIEAKKAKIIWVFLY